MALKTFNEFLNAMLTRYKNQAPAEDISTDSLAFIRFSCTASMLWGMQREREHLSKQIFPDTCTSDNLTHHAWVMDVLKQPGESDASLLDRLLARMRKDGGAGSTSDYEEWARSASVAADTLHNPSSDNLSATGLGAFSASQAVDGSLTSIAWNTDTATAGATATIDLGTGSHRSYTKVRLYMSGDNSAAVYAIEYSDDGESWDSAGQISPSESAWNETDWDSVGSHRYWRLQLGNDPGAGPDVMQMEWYAAAELVGNAKAYSCPRGVGTVDVLVIGASHDGDPTDTLLQAVSDIVHDMMPADLPPENVRVLRPTYTTQHVSIQPLGSGDQNALISDIEAYLNSLEPGQVMYVDKLKALAIDNGYNSANVFVPSSNLVPDQYEVIRSGTITIS